MRRAALALGAALLFAITSDPAIAQREVGANPRQGGAAPRGGAVARGGDGSAQAQGRGGQGRGRGRGAVVQGSSIIRGVVTAADTNTPLRRAQVVASSAQNGPPRAASSDANGRFELAGLPAGQWTVTASKGGFVSQQYGQRRSLESVAPIDLGDGQRFTANFALSRGGVITGRISDEYGDPVTGARVEVLRLQTAQGRRRLVPAGTANQTDDTGAFRVYGLPPGEYYVTASTGLIDAVKRDPPVYYPGTWNFAEAQPISLAAGAQASADFQIVNATRAGTVSGIVVNSSGAPAAGAMVNLTSDALSQAPGAQSALMLHDDAAADGTFTIQNVPPGPYVLSAQMPMRELDAGFIAAQRDALRTAGGPPPPPMFNMPETATQPIVVTSEGVSGITLNTRSGGRVIGRFVADTGVTRRLPTGLIARLRSSSSPGGMQMTMNGGNDAGDFQLAGIGGPSRFEVEGVPEGWAVKAILLDGEDVTDETFDLSGKTGTLRVVMTDRLTSLTGTVQSNHEIRDHNVVVFADDATKWTVPSRFVRTTRADADGRFQIRGLPPGERYLAAAVEYLEDGEEQDRQLLERMRSRATSVTLGDGEPRSIQLDLQGR